MGCDAHNHLHDPRFAGRQADLIATARAAGVSAMVVNGTSPTDWPAVRACAEAFPDVVVPSFGLHPWYVPARPADWERQLIAMLDAFPAAGVGEIGLDRWKADLPWDDQVAVFLRQLALAAERNRPVSIHGLKAWDPLLALLEKHPRPARGFLLHSYGGPARLIDRFAALGAYFSLSGAVAHPNRAAQANVFRHVPPDRLLIESDAPDQRPPLDGSDADALNTPANLPTVYTPEICETP